MKSQIEKARLGCFWGGLLLQLQGCHLCPCHHCAHGQHEHDRARNRDRAQPGNARVRASHDDQRQKVGNLRELVRKFRAADNEVSVQEFKKFITSEVAKLGASVQQLEKVQTQGESNTDIYLSWDHLDVYFATSIRQRWEYEQVFDFIKQLMAGERLQGLNLRYFDPTQSFDRNRINKGLIEALMLKRAKCTVYSVQDTDTFGKDSELAVTLAQGKPVIAFAPETSVDLRTKELVGERASSLIERLNFLIDVDKDFTARFRSDLDFLESFVDKLNQFEDGMFWRSVLDEGAGSRLRDENAADLERFCGLLARSEKVVYDKRAATLKDFHPLGLQVNLETGVANGVLVVRSVAACAELLYRVLTNSMEFSIREDRKTDCWHLVETVSDSIFRVVTKDHKITNCFWNFYL